MCGLKGVGILTNQHPKCGNYLYAVELGNELSRWYAVSMDSEPDWFLKDGFDVVIVNWHPARVTVTKQMVEKWKSKGKKVILILQNSFDTEMAIGEQDILNAVDAVVAHEPMKLTGVRVEYIPHGIPIVTELRTPTEPRIGTAGFPFPWKRFDVVAEAAKRFGVKCRMIAPRHEFYDSKEFIEGIKGHLGGLAEVTEEWLPVDEVVRRLSECTVNIFWYESKVVEDQLGQSGSVRMGIAARRPIIISQHRKLWTLFGYLDELYIAKTEEQVYEYVAEILKGKMLEKRPERLLQEQGWPATAEKYHELIERVCN